MKGEALFVIHSDTLTATLEKITICHTGYQLRQCKNNFNIKA